MGLSRAWPATNPKLSSRNPETPEPTCATEPGRRSRAVGCNRTEQDHTCVVSASIYVAWQEPRAGLGWVKYELEQGCHWLGYLESVQPPRHTGISTQVPSLC